MERGRVERGKDGREDDGTGRENASTGRSSQS